MLDDLQQINERDGQDALGIASKQWQQLTYEFEFDKSSISNHQFENVVLAGMGGSALAALVAQSWPRLNVPFEVVRDYDIPSYVNENTLFISSSYSGNTEETVNTLDQASKTGASIVVIASGGKLEEIASANNYPFLKVPTGYQPRHVVSYDLKALCEIFDASGLTSGASAELTSTSEWLKQQIENWIATVPTASNQAKQLALECLGKSVVIYAGPKLASAAYKWKISFNENAKHIAWWNFYSEFNHNEFIGWTRQPVDKPYAVIELRSNLEHPEIGRRFEISNRLLSGQKPESLVVDCQGETLLQQLLWTIALGDFVTLYVALAGGINPTPVDLIEKLKAELEK